MGSKYSILQPGTPRNWIWYLKAYLCKNKASEQQVKHSQQLPSLITKNKIRNAISESHQPNLTLEACKGPSCSHASKDAACSWIAAGEHSAVSSKKGTAKRVLAFTTDTVGSERSQSSFVKLSPSFKSLQTPPSKAGSTEKSCRRNFKMFITQKEDVAQT